MSKYRILAHPDTHDTYLDSDEFDTIDEAVKQAIKLTYSDNFLIVQVVDWKADQYGESLKDVIISKRDVERNYWSKNYDHKPFKEPTIPVQLKGDLTDGSSKKDSTDLRQTIINKFWPEFAKTLKYDDLNELSRYMINEIMAAIEDYKVAGITRLENALPEPSSGWNADVVEGERRMLSEVRTILDKAKRGEL